MYYTSFELYVKDHPDGEKFRNWMTNFGKRDKVWIFPGQGPHGSIPGGFVWATVSQYGHMFVVAVHDSDDGMAQKSFHKMQSALQEVESLCQVSYVDMARHLKGYRWG